MTVNTNDLLARLDHVHLLRDLNASCDQIVSRLVAVNLEAPYTTGGLQLFDNYCLLRTGQDWNWRLVFGHKASETACISDYNNELNVEIENGLNSGRGNRFGSVEWGRCVQLDVCVVCFVVDAAFSLGADFGHNGNSLDRVGSVGTLT